MNRDTDVLIAGYGPVGATAAALLANAGLDVTIVEQEKSYHPLPRAAAVDDDAIRVWETVAGLGDRATADLITNPEVTYETTGDRVFARVEPALAQTPSGYPAIALFHQPTLEAELRRTAENFENLTALNGTKLTGFTQDAEGVTVTLTDAASGEERTMRAGWLLGCDGATSTVRKEIGSEFGGSTFRQRWIVTDLILGEKETGTSRIRFLCDPARPAVTMPMPSGRRRWEFMLFDGEGDEMIAEGPLGEMLREAGQAPGYSDERTTIYTFHARMASKWSDGRVFLVGDSAHVTPPFAGQGMNSGVRDAGNIWWKIAAVERGAAEQVLLDSYVLERRRHVKDMIDLAVRLGAIVQTTRPAIARLRDAFFAVLLKLPGMKPWFTRMGWKPATLIRKGFLQGGARSPRSAVGTQVPALEVTMADGSRGKLDDRVGPRFALLSSGADPWLGVEPGLRGMAEKFGVEVIGAGAEPAVGKWLREIGASTALVRPDRFVYGTWK